MSTRAEDMATIEAALEDLQEQAEAEQPGDAAPPTIDELVEQEQKKEEQEEKEEEQEGKEASAPPARAARLTQSAGDATQSVAQFAGGLWQSATALLERARTPGGLFLPIALLVLFFFVLIPINGYSRIAWLWLVLTGNAQLAGDAQAIATREQAMQTLAEQTLGQLAAAPSTSTSSSSAPSMLPVPPLATGGGAGGIGNGIGILPEDPA